MHQTDDNFFRRREGGTHLLSCATASSHVQSRVTLDHNHLKRITKVNTAPINNNTVVIELQCTRLMFKWHYDRMFTTYIK